ncbi:MAG: acyltransferase [Chroococcidiopsidaceae cyanobacterium CP_BM_ER_R8_30]|nr:acyltransferase [Chroococcidiopsidaceae cyanobacterium CP_BM_ER_R8_30]
MEQQREEIQFSGLPLTVYREIAAHLSQVEGIQTGLCPAVTEEFNYNQSQVGGLWIQYAQTASLQSRQQVEQILAYYRDRYGLNKS